MEFELNGTQRRRPSLPSQHLGMKKENGRGGLRAHIPVDSEPPKKCRNKLSQRKRLGWADPQLQMIF